MKRLSLQQKEFMKHYIVSVLLFFICCTATKAITAKPQDSVGIAKLSSNYFIIHEVENRQTLFALSKIYGVSIQEILEANEGMRPALATGQLLYVPAKNFKPAADTKFSSIVDGKLSSDEETVTETPKKEEPQKTEPKKEVTPKKQEAPKAEPSQEEEADIDLKAIADPDKFNWDFYYGDNDLYHTVKRGETLYKIATYYGISVQEVMELNRLDNSLIEVGQKLLIKKGEEKKATPTKKSEPQPKPEKKPEPEPEPQKEPETIEEPVVEKPAEQQEEPTTISPTGEIKQEGYGMVIEDKDFPDIEKNIALHATAKVGTIILVTNTANGKTVYVRVVGKLKSDDKSIILLLSPEAAKTIEAKDNKVKLRLSYAQ